MSDSAAASVPKGYKTHSGAAKITLDDVTDDTTELWLFEVPRKFDVSELSGVKIRTDADTTLNRDFVAKKVEALEYSHIVSLFPTNDKHLAAGKTFAKHFKVMRQVVVPTTPYDKIKKDYEAVKDIPIPQLKQMNYKLVLPGSGLPPNPPPSQQPKNNNEADSKKKATTTTTKKSSSKKSSSEGKEEKKKKKKKSKKDTADDEASEKKSKKKRKSEDNDGAASEEASTATKKKKKNSSSK